MVPSCDPYILHVSLYALLNIDIAHSTFSVLSNGPLSSSLTWGFLLRIQYPAEPEQLQDYFNLLPFARLVLLSCR